MRFFGSFPPTNKWIKLRISTEWISFNLRLQGTQSGPSSHAHARREYVRFVLWTIEVFRDCSTFLSCHKHNACVRCCKFVSHHRFYCIILIRWFSPSPFLHSCTFGLNVCHNEKYGFSILFPTCSPHTQTLALILNQSFKHNNHYYHLDSGGGNGWR